MNLQKALYIIRLVNRVLFILIIIFSLYISFAPLSPQIAYAFEDRFVDREGIKPVNISNALVIKKIFVNGSVLEGSNEDVLTQGFWRRPNASTPDKGGNTVVVGHRYMYTHGPETLYHLDKLNIDDEIEVYWKNKKYTYSVFDISEVDPDQIEIEYNTIEPILTIYTCTPLWTAEKRLVIKAKLISTD